MRYVATSLLLALFTIGTSVPVQARSRHAGPAYLTAPEAVVPMEPTEAQEAFGVLEETPNQRRLRLGQPIVASYPPPEYGELMETPNQRRARLHLPPQEAEEYGEARETPNQQRELLKAQTALLKQ
jgi:hypothetical protein